MKAGVGKQVRVGWLLWLAAAASCSGQGARVPASPEEAAAQVEGGDLQGAETTLRRCLDQDPTDLEATKRLAWVMFQTLRGREIEELLEEALERFPGNEWILVNLLQAEFRPLPPRDALAWLQGVHSRRPGQVIVLRAMAWSYWQTGATELAREKFAEALQLEPDNAESRLAAAAFLFELGEMEKAAELLAAKAGGPAMECPALFADDDRWWSLCGQLAEAGGNPRAAKTALERALALRPRERDYLQQRGRLLQALGDDGRAGDSFAAASRVERCRVQLRTMVLAGEADRPTPKVCLELAELCRQRGRSRQAEGWLKLARRLKRQPPGDDLVYGGAGRAGGGWAGGTPF